MIAVGLFLNCMEWILNLTVEYKVLDYASDLALLAEWIEATILALYTVHEEVVFFGLEVTRTRPKFSTLMAIV